MLRGLNALYLQAPYITHTHTHTHDPHNDISDFLFLAQAWAVWVLEHHTLKERVLVPGFEAALGLAPGDLGRRVEGVVERGGGGDDGERGSGRELEGEGEGDVDVDRGGKGKGKEIDQKEENNEKDGEKEKEEKQNPIPTHLTNLHTYALTTLSTLSTPSSPSYSPTTLRALLSALAGNLVPHLHAQILVFLQMKDLCPSPSPSRHPRSHKPTPAPEPLLSQSHLSFTATHNTTMDRFTVLPMLMHSRDITYENGSGGRGGGRVEGKNDWPGLSVPAVHAVADRLAPKHAGAWRFLPCDVWGRPRELVAFGFGEKKGGGGLNE